MTFSFKRKINKGKIDLRPPPPASLKEFARIKRALLKVGWAWCFSTVIFGNKHTK